MWWIFCELQSAFKRSIRKFNSTLIFQSIYSDCRHNNQKSADRFAKSTADQSEKSSNRRRKRDSKHSLLESWIEEALNAATFLTAVKNTRFETIDFFSHSTNPFKPFPVIINFCHIICEVVNQLSGHACHETATMGRHGGQDRRRPKTVKRKTYTSIDI